MIYINGQQLDSIGALSARAQTVLSMIPGGQKWLSWCIADTTVSTINPANENQLLSLIQQGLSADGTIRFNTFRANISKILSMSDTDIAQLAAIQRTVNDNEANLAVLLQQNNMLSYGDMTSATELSTQLVSVRPDLFQIVSFDDMLILADFVKEQQAVETSIQTQSNAFALANAATIADFVNLSLFFQYMLNNPLSGNLISQIQNNEIQAIYTQLQAVILPYLFTPSTDITSASGGLIQAVPDVARATSFIGYTTASSAILNLVQNIEITDIPGANQQTAISTYLAAVKNIISSAPNTGHILSQNGMMATLTFQSDQSLASVGVDRDGTVFLLPNTKLNLN